MNNISMRAQGIYKANTYFHAVSDRMTSYMQHIKESYTSFINRLLWNEIGDVRQSSSGLKKELKATAYPNSVLITSNVFMRSENGPTQKSSIVKSVPQFQKEELSASAFLSSALVEVHSTGLPILAINNPCNEILEKYYEEDPTLADIKAAYVANDGQVYDVLTVAKLNGKSPITRERLAAIKDQTFIQALEQQKETGNASAILRDAITNEPLTDPVITTDGRRINRSTLDCSSVKGLSNDFRLFNLLKEYGLSLVVKQEPLTKQDFNELITDIRKTNIHVEEEYLGITHALQPTYSDDRAALQILRSLVDEMVIEHNQFKVEMGEYRAEIREYRAEIREYRAEIREYRAEIHKWTAELR